MAILYHVNDKNKGICLNYKILANLALSCQKNVFAGGISSSTKIISVLFIGCGEKGPLNDSNYRASSAFPLVPARFAALDTSNPSASRVAWCLRQDDVGGYLELNLGTMYLRYHTVV